MKRNLINDRNYPTIESFADSSGDFNTALSKSEKFKSLTAYRTLLEKTSELDVFSGIEPRHRFAFYIGGMKIDWCVKCGKPFVYFPKSQKRFSTCRHKQIADAEKFRGAIAAGRKNKIDSFIHGLLDEDTLLDEQEYRGTMLDMIAKPANYAYIVTKDEYRAFYHDLIIKTKHIIPVNEKDLKIPERLYIDFNRIPEIPSCEYCGKPGMKFVNRFIGYGKSCPECEKTKSDKTREANNRADIDAVFDFSKYEIIKYPRLLNRDSLVVKCRKCGKESEWLANNGMLSRIRGMPLCRHCERRAGWEETEFFEFISSIYDGEKIHGAGGRKIISPYELDVYLPDKNIAFEYDGVYWHNDTIKDGRNYHLMKTNKCAEKNIRLIHVFSSDWNMKREITESRIKNLLGIYGRTVYARKCEVREVDSKTSREFQEKNHIQGAANAKVNLGLYFRDELIALMTFGKCRFDKTHEWELIRFCSRLDYHIPGGAGRLLKYFERNWKPKSLVSYADRRWSDGKLYKALDFVFERNSPPNYWYFKTRTDKLLSRVNFQKHKLKDVLENFDPSKSEYENMKDNGYYRIFDCGNMVFVKEYEKDPE